MSIKLLEEERSYLRELLDKQSQLLDQEKTKNREIQENYEVRASEFVNELRSEIKQNKQLSIENTELIEKVKISKITTKVEFAEKIIIMTGNLIFISIQCLNLYHKMFDKASVDPAKVQRLMTLINTLIHEINTTRVNETALNRAVVAVPGGHTNTTETNSVEEVLSSTDTVVRVSGTGLTSGPIPVEDVL